MQKIVFVFVILFLPTVIFAQNFGWEVNVDDTDSSGFHKIILTPDLTSKLTSGFVDLRLFDDNEMEIPFLLRTEKKIISGEQFHKFKLVENKHHKRHSYTKVILENTARFIVSNLYVTMVGREANKLFRISGSNNKKEWYIIKDNFYKQSNFEESDSVQIALYDFAPTNYLYYEILLYDIGSEPIPILNVSTYADALIEIEYSDILAPNISQSDTAQNNKSVVDISFNQPYYFDKIVFEVKGPTYFFRKAILKTIDTLYEQKFKMGHFNLLDKQMIISSKLENVIYLSNHKARKLRLIIENGDNVPLTIRSVKAYQLHRYIIADLKSGFRYKLKFGDEKLSAPLYDLRFFEDSIPEEMPTLKVGKTKKIKKADQNEKVTYKIDILYLWGIAIVLVLLLLVFAFRMFFNMENR